MTRQTIRATWQSVWQDSAIRLGLLITLPLLVVTLSMLARFLEGIEQRPGVVVSDPVLALFAPHDVTWVTFLLIYAGLFGAIAILMHDPRRLLLAIHAYMIMVVFRVCAMSLLPLDPPQTMIPLTDPFVEYFGTGISLSRDLFFSGHTSTLFLLSLTMQARRWRALFFFCTAAVACCVLIQHIHYTVDVFVAPFFAYASYRLALSIHSRLF
jgi:hypothetical protein